MGIYLEDMNKISLSRKEQDLISVERLLSCIGKLHDKANKIHLEWYPKKLQEAISKFMYNDVHNIIRVLVEWIEENVDEEV